MGNTVTTLLPDTTGETLQGSRRSESCQDRGPHPVRGRRDIRPYSIVTRRIPDLPATVRVPAGEPSGTRPRCLSPRIHKNALATHTVAGTFVREVVAFLLPSETQPALRGMGEFVFARPTDRYRYRRS